MREHEVAPPKGFKQTQGSKRLGRGHGSGRGTTAGRGTKGQNSRTGVHRRPGFEGGQLPIIKRLPRLRGFRNRFRITYQVVNLNDLEKLHKGATVTRESLVKAGLIRNDTSPLKVLGTGELKKALHVKAHKFSASAKDKIAAAGGTVEEIDAGASPTASA